MKIKKIKKRKGITLIELMIVLVILGIVMTALMVTFSGGDSPAMSAAREIQLKSAKSQLDMALFRFYTQFGRYPTTDEGLHALVEAPPGIDEGYPSGGFITNPAALVDPWKNPYTYELEGSSQYKIISYGADGNSGGSGEDADIDLSQLK